MVTNLINVLHGKLNNYTIDLKMDISKDVINFQNVLWTRYLELTSCLVKQSLCKHIQLFGLPVG